MCNWKACGWRFGTIYYAEALSKAEQFRWHKQENSCTLGWRSVSLSLGGYTTPFVSALLNRCHYKVCSQRWVESSHAKAHGGQTLWMQAARLRQGFQVNKGVWGRGYAQSYDDCCICLMRVSCFSCGDAVVPILSDSYETVARAEWKLKKWGGGAWSIVAYGWFM